jgi:hypothetical protein
LFCGRHGCDRQAEVRDSPWKIDVQAFREVVMNGREDDLVDVRAT